MTGTEGIAATLREPFPANQIGKLPRVTCGDCSDKRKTCDRHQRQRCDTCKAYVSTAHIHLDYVGHADVTDRLLQADPEWNWEPLATDEHGLPVLDTDASGGPVGLWIKLTAGGMTRLGYGSCPSGQNDAVKVLIGDALRNAAMRFGVALDLWAKGDRADPSAENATASGGKAERRRPRQQQQEEAGPAEHSADADDGDWGVWHDVIKDIASDEDAEKADEDLREVFKSGAMGPTKAKNIRAAIKAKRDSLGNAKAEPAPDMLAQRFGGEATAAQSADELRGVHRAAMRAGKLQEVISLDNGYTGTLLGYITSRKAELEKNATGQAASQ